MTIVEFFDTNAVENIVSTLLCAPERVILVGHKVSMMEQAKVRYEEIAAAHGITVTFIPKGIDRNNLLKIVDVLEDIVQTYGECTFDLTGGDDLYLVAVGSVFCAHREQVQLHRFNIQNGRMYDCDADGKVLATKHATLTVEENIKAYGGRVIFEDEKPDKTYRWNFSEEFCADVKTMWEICKGNFTRWNETIHTLDAFYRYIQQDKNALSVCIAVDTAKAVLERRIECVSFDGGLFGDLQRNGLIQGLVFTPGQIAFSFKNDQVKRALTNAGRVLELFVAVVARETTDDAGAPFFTDVMTGVTIDWDGKLETVKKDVDNEIDVLLMKDMIPIFVSCKNGKNFGSDELYKLSLVAERFGGQYAKQILVATQLDDMKNGQDLTERAKAMHIHVVSDLDGIVEGQRILDEMKKWVN